MIDWLVKRYHFLFIAFFVIINGYLIYTGRTPLIGIGLAAILIIIYTAFFHLDKLFWLVVFFTPISISLEDYGEFGIGVSLPTEPFLLGILTLIFVRSLYYKTNTKISTHPISIAVILYLSIIFLTSLSSSNPLVSLKFLLAKMWLIIPAFYFGAKLFEKKNNIYRFLIIYTIPFAFVVIYTLIRHASMGFEEDPGHWVMQPFFKDHTSYGAIIAMFLPTVVAFYFINKKNSLLRSGFIVLLIVFLIGLYFSYTRAAWLSMIFGVAVFCIIYFRVKFKILSIIALLAGVFVIMNWNEIQYQLSKNDAEHTTEEFGERIQSMSNISTDASNLERLNRWNCAIEMFKERPVLGWGPGTYMFEYTSFQQSKDLTIISTNFSDGGNAHSEYLSALSESGVIGLAAFLILVATIFYKGITLYSIVEDKELKIILSAVIVGLSTYFVHGILNNYLDSDKAAIPVWGFAGIIVAIDIFHKNRQLNKAVSSK
ncbi:MAG: O-antigen ligase family protein [Bacteroidia bacterium]